MNNKTASNNELQLDVSGVSSGITEVDAMMEELWKTADSIGAGISEAFAPVLDTLSQMQAGIESASSAFLSFDAGILGSIESSITGSIGGIEKVSETLNKYVTVVGDIQSKKGAYFTELFPKTNELVSSVKGLADSAASGFGTMTNKMGSMLGNINPIFAVVMAAVVALVVLIIQNWDTIKAALATAAEWLNTTVIQPIISFFTGLWTSIVTITTQIWNGIVSVFSTAAQWIYDSVIVPIMNFFIPIVAWFAELFGNVWQTISDVFYNIGVIASGCWDVICAVWQVVSQWFNSTVIQPVMQFFSNLWTSITQFATTAWTNIQNILATIGSWIDTNVIQPVTKFFSSLWEGFTEGATQAWEGIKAVFGAVAGFFEQIFSDAWANIVAVFDVAGDIFVNIKDGILNAFKVIVNGLIGGLNRVVAVPFNGINSAIRLIKRISILGLTPFSNLRTITVPSIPYLAQGAVLPANRPFLAMVGDQRHGTNVEAPLATIQEAVALVMNDQMDAMMAGFGAVVRAINEKNATLELDGREIWSAYNSYNRKAAVVRKCIGFMKLWSGRPEQGLIKLITK